MLTDPKFRSQVDALWDKYWAGTWVESLPLTSFGNFVRGRDSAFEPREAERQVEGLFESLLHEAFNG